jgi:hypothetical protein
MARDEFSPSVKDALAKRVAFHCSNPKCNVATSGPHTEVTRSVNLGVASHITAAASGGPRFDELLTPEERSGIDNGIWLCQRCAKLVDSDLTHYSVSHLKTWKVNAEARALRALSGDVDYQFFPQPPSAVHAPIPRIAGLPYEEARELLLEAGWQPRSRHWSHGSDPNVQAGNGLYFWQKGYWELINAWPTGLAQCTFGFHDVYGNLLTVTTVGEVIEEISATAHVCNWSFKREA